MASAADEQIVGGLALVHVVAYCANEDVAVAGHQLVEGAPPTAHCPEFLEILHLGHTGPLFMGSLSCVLIAEGHAVHSNSAVSG